VQYARTFRKTKQSSLTIEQLHNKLTELKVPADAYYLHGLYGSTDDNDKLALTIRMGKHTVEYDVYFKERGQQDSIAVFYTEDEACNYLLKKIVDNFTFEKIQKIDGLSGMTVNERLYVSGLMNEFDIAKQKDKTRAKEILRWLRVDEKSIQQILQ